MATKIVMPELGESIIEGVIVQWFKSVGESLRKGEPLLLVDTDKVSTEIESPLNGVLLQIIAEQDATVAVGAVIGWVGQAGEQVNGTVTAQAQPSIVKDQSSVGFVSPVVARMAAHHNLDLTQITGTGRRGRITKKNVLAYLESNKQKAKTQKPKADTKKEPVAEQTVGQAIRQPSSAQAKTVPEGELLPLSAMRRTIARHMVHSKQTAPHVTTVLEVDLQKVLAHRKIHKQAFAKDGVNLTFTAYFMAACGQMLKRHRMVNSSWTDEGILLHKHVHIGMATDLGERGLIVPVIKHASDLSLLGTARAVNNLANRARSNRLQANDVRGGTFTITNYGTNGPLFATPIINQPQAAILGVGLIQKRPVVRQFEGEDVIVIRPMVYLAMTFDHRILDGATADAFLRDLIHMLENWT